MKNPFEGCRKAGLTYGLDRVDPKAYDGWTGECPGCTLDALNACDKYSSRGLTMVPLLDNAASLDRICEEADELTRDFEPRDLFVIHGSSHGGRIPDLDGDEKDGYDETICLWDGELVDDRVWQLLNALPICRVLLVTDSCHSDTVAKTQLPMPRPALLLSNEHGLALHMQLIHVAGCNDPNVSYGSTAGGWLTNAWLKALDEAHDYRHWFKRTKVRMPIIRQRPTWTEYNVSSMYRKAAPLT